MGFRKSFPNGFICNIIDEYIEGTEIVSSIQNAFQNGKVPNIANIVEQATNLPNGSLNNRNYARCFLALPQISLNEDEKRVGDLYREDDEYGPEYLLLFKENWAIAIVTRAKNEQLEDEARDNYEEWIRSLGW